MRKAGGSRAPSALQRPGDPAPGLTASSHLALGWAHHTPVLMAGRAHRLGQFSFSSDQNPARLESMWLGIQDALLLAPVLPEPSSATLGMSQPLLGLCFPVYQVKDWTG